MMNDIKLISPKVEPKSKTAPKGNITPLDELLALELLNQQLVSKNWSNPDEQIRQLQKRIAVLECKLALLE